MTSKFVSRQFGPFMISNRRWGKHVDPYFAIGFKSWPVTAADLTVEVGPTQDRMTATRILTGGALLGPAGMILGGLARKDITRGRITLTVNGQTVQAYEFPANQLDRALDFVQALADLQE